MKVTEDFLSALESLIKENIKCVGGGEDTFKKAMINIYKNDLLSVQDKHEMFLICIQKEIKDLTTGM
jgi:hypothetical protein